MEHTFKIKPLIGRRRRGTIFVISNFRQFQEIYKSFSPNLYRFNGFYIIAIVSDHFQEVELIFKLLWDISVYNVILISEGINSTVDVTTFIPFDKQNCNDTSPITINKFQDGRFTNGAKNLFIDKMKNLQKCYVRVAVSNTSTPAVIAQNIQNGSFLTELSGRDINLINALAWKLNFRINYTFIGKEGYLYSNGTSKGPLKALLGLKADLSLSDWWLKENRLKFFDSSNSYISDSIIFVVPSGEELSALYKLIHPFTPTLWIFVSFCFLFGVVTILVVKRQAKATQMFVFGAGVHNPLLNLFIAFIGGYQPVLPIRNFARFILMTFILYSLVIRTLYQGAYFQLLQTNKQFNAVQ